MDIRIEIQRGGGATNPSVTKRMAGTWAKHGGNNRFGLRELFFQLTQSRSFN